MIIRRRNRKLVLATFVSLSLITALNTSVARPAAGAQTSFHPYQDLVIADGATAYWTFDEFPFEEVIGALTPNFNPAAGQSTTTPLDTGNSLLLDSQGEESFAVNSSPAADLALLPLDQLTVEGWFATVLSDSMNIAHTSGSPGAPGGPPEIPAYSLQLSGGNLTASVNNADGEVSIVTTQTLNDGSLHHFALTYDGTGTDQGAIKLYVDGVLVGNEDNFGGQIVYAVDSSLQGPLLGNTAVTNPSFLVDELAIYHSALTELQVDAHIAAATDNGNGNGFPGDPHFVWGTPPPSSTSAGDPVEPSSGNFFDTWTDMSFGGAMSMLDFRRTYNSLDDRVGVMGKGWSTIFDVSAEDVVGGVEIRTRQGRTILFEDDGGGGWDRPSEFLADLVDTGASYHVDFFDGTVWNFDAQGRLSGIQSWDGQSVAVGRDGNDDVSDLEWSSGTGETAEYALTLNPAGLISGLATTDGRSVTYSRDSNGFLTGVTGPDAGTETYAVDAAGVIAEVFDEENRLVIRNTYDAQGRVSLQEIATGNTVSFVYDDAALTTTVTDSASGDVTVYSYNPSRQLIGITDANGQNVSRSYDVQGNPTSAVDRRGETLVRTFDANDNLTSSTDETGQTTSYAHDSDNRLTTVTEPDGDMTTYSYTGANRIPTTIVEADGATSTYVSADGLVTSITDPDGLQTMYTYDPARNVISTTDGIGNTTAYTYDDIGRPVSSTSPTGATTSTTYDVEGRVLSSTDSTGEVSTFVYDQSGLLTSRTDPTGAVESYAYDSSGRTETVTDANGRISSSTYNSNGDLITVTDPDGETTSFTFGALARSESVTDPTGVATLYGYDESGNQTSTTDGNGQTTSTTYDETRRPIATTDALGNSTSTTYGAEGRVATKTDRLGNTTTFTYDSAGRLSATTLSDGTIESRTYTSAGLLSTSTDGNGNTTSYGYDAAGRRTTVTNPSGGVTTTAYDADGRVTSVTSPGGLTTSATYDGNGRQLSTTDPNGATQTTSYSPRGEVLSNTDPNGATTAFAFDGAGQLSSTTDPNGGSAGYSYDGTGSRISRTSAAGHVESWTVDGADRPTTATNPLGDSTTTTYDNLGRVSTVTDPSGRTTTTAYDARGQIDQMVYSDGASSYTVDYTYDAAGRTTSMTDPDGQWQWSYDTRGRLTGVTEPDGSTLGYGYDAVGNRTSLTYPDGTTASYTFDSLNRITAVTHPTAGTTSYIYDADGRPLSETLPDGDSRSWVYTDGRVTSYTDTQIGTTTIVYDAARRVVSTSGAENWSFTYDTAGQLTDASRDGRAWQYGYDSVGNVVSIDDSTEGLTTYTVDAANRLTGGTDADGDLGFEYDAAGRLTKETSGDWTVTAWTYDVRGLPVEIVTSSGDGGDDMPGCDANLVFTIVGTDGDDVIVGTDGDDIIAGLGGADVIDAKGGNDIVCAGRGPDIVTGGDGDDLLVGGRGADELRGNKGDDIIRGRRGNDQLFGGNGGDELHGGRGDDIVKGGNGHDLMFAGSGTDILEGGDGNDEIHARKGADLVRGEKGDDLLFGGKGPDEIHGGEGNDELHGRRGGDSLFGGAGSDILDGGKGNNDVLNGGAGNDDCDDGETNTNCETITTIGNANNPIRTPTVVSTQTRRYDGQGTLTEVTVNGETTNFTWDQTLPVAQIIETMDSGSTASIVYGLGRVASVTGANTDVFAYTVTGDATQIADAYSPYGEPLSEADDIGFGYRGELHLGNRIHLRARDLSTNLARFTTVDPLDGNAGTVVETNPYHYANNDPINLIDPRGLSPQDGVQADDRDIDQECRASTASIALVALEKVGVLGRVELAGFIPEARSTLIPVVDKVGLYYGDDRFFADGPIPRNKSRFFMEIDFVQGTAFIQVNPTQSVDGTCFDAWPIRVGSLDRTFIENVNKFEFGISDSHTEVRVRWSVVHGDNRLRGGATRVAFDGALNFNVGYYSQAVDYNGDCFPSIEAYSFASDGSFTTLLQQASKHPNFGLAPLPDCHKGDLVFLE